MSISEDKWFEVWFVDGTDVAPTYLLIVSTDEREPGNVVVRDPQEGHRIVHQGENYHDTLHWLTEDEFDQVEGRMFPDDGWPLNTGQG
jgi:hypothetical protein